MILVKLYLCLVGVLYCMIKSYVLIIFVIENIL